MQVTAKVTKHGRPASLLTGLGLVLLLLLGLEVHLRHTRASRAFANAHGQARGEAHTWPLLWLSATLTLPLTLRVLQTRLLVHGEGVQGGVNPVLRCS